MKNEYDLNKGRSKDIQDEETASAKISHAAQCSQKKKLLLF